MICIKGGNIIDGISNEPYRGDILIEKNKVMKIGRSLDINFPNSVVIDAAGLYVLPGLIDMHCHLGSRAMNTRRI